MYSIVLNTTNITNLGNGNNRLKFNFPSSMRIENQTIAITQISMFYCWENITTILGNNSLTFTFPNGTNNDAHTLNIPNGNYEISDLNNLLHLYQKERGLYLIDDKGNDEYFIALTLFTTEYSVLLHCTNLPITLPTGWSYPDNRAFTLPDSSRTPSLTIPYAFGKIIGFSPGTYPYIPQSVAYTKLSDSCPQISPIQCLLFSCNLCYNPFSSNPSVIYSTTNNDTPYGAIIPNTIYNPIYSDIQPGSYNYIEVSITDQNMNPVELLDPDILLLLTIKPIGRL